jgi:hypothetical protein
MPASKRLSVKPEDLKDANQLNSSADAWRIIQKSKDDYPVVLSVWIRAVSIALLDAKEMKDA